MILSRLHAKERRGKDPPFPQSMNISLSVCSKLPPGGISFKEGKVIEQPEHEIIFTDAFSEHTFKRVFEMHILDTQTFFILKISALTEKTRENLRLVKFKRMKSTRGITITSRNFPMINTISNNHFYE